ncbi:MAG: protocatechuate 3,4-dioxygenase subunit alpha [Hyphomicrobiaceae bacterium]
MALKETPSQTIGPYFAYGLTAEQYGYPLDQIAGGNLLAECPEVEGDRIEIVGHVLDGEGATISDAMVEIWQADAEGRYAHPADPRTSNSRFRGFGRFGTGTEPDNVFRFRTIKPGSPDRFQAPHMNVTVFARGLLLHVVTRLYFADEDKANQRDPVLALVPIDRRHTLIASTSGFGNPNCYRFDIHLQGEKETVFFDTLR